MQDGKGPKGYHDVGGDAAGEIPMVELPWLHWEKKVGLFVAFLAMEPVGSFRLMKCAEGLKALVSKNTIRFRFINAALKP